MSSEGSSVIEESEDIIEDDYEEGKGSQDDVDDDEDEDGKDLDALFGEDFKDIQSQSS